MQEFEWDDAKSAANLQKHGIGFDQAVWAFRDPFAVEWIDERHDYGEERVALLGRANDLILVIVYAERNDRIRIISARRATRHEREIYIRENARR